jgi:general secretion pathway protein I
MKLNCRGFTLLEVMVAVAVIAIGLTALLGSHSQSVSLAAEAKFYTTAALLAQRKMAELELAGFQDLDHEAGDFGEDFSGYRWEVQAGAMDLQGYETVTKYIKQIKLAIQWGESGQYTYTVKFFHVIPSE